MRMLTCRAMAENQNIELTGKRKVTNDYHSIMRNQLRKWIKRGLAIELFLISLLVIT